MLSWHFLLNCRESVGPITFDPLQASREDYKRLKAHYRMLFEAGNRHAEQARTASAQAHEAYQEAERIHEQMSVLERLSPEVTR